MSLRILDSWDDVPSFASTVEEAKFWLDHQLSVSLMQEACVGSDTIESTTITLRMDPRMLARLKRLAAQRYLNYQSMLKQWVAERLERELKDLGNG